MLKNLFTNKKDFTGRFRAYDSFKIILLHNQKFVTCDISYFNL